MAAEALIAFRNGGDPDDPDAEMVGALLIAEFMGRVTRFLTKE